MQLMRGKRPLGGSLVLFFAFALIGVGVGFSGSALAEGAVADGAVVVERAWSRPALQGGNGAVYFTIENRGKTAVTLIGASSDVAEAVEIHETTLVSGEHGDHHAAHDHDGHGHAHDHDAHGHGAHQHGAPAGAGMFVMHHLEQLEIPGNSSVEFRPTGLHIMLINLERTLAWGETFPITLHFSGAPSITAWVTVGDEPVNDN